MCSGKLNSRITCHSQGCQLTTSTLEADIKDICKAGLGKTVGKTLVKGPVWILAHFPLPVFCHAVKGIVIYFAPLQLGGLCMSKLLAFSFQVNTVIFLVRYI
jgi:hypothetical protein